ncbi:MAG: hypothetical protein JST87_18650 [Bacteroidetes bacterium]|nr:hypothetical protein [Bacteroidota bacterium]
MKKLFYILCFFIYKNAAISQTAFSGLSLNGISGTSISLSTYLGKKTIIAVCSTSSPDTKRLKSLDSLYKTGAGNLAVVIIPVEDFDASQSLLAGLTQLTSVLKKSLVDSLHLSVAITQPVYGKKAAVNQNSLLQWLTNKSSNAHFDYDLASTNQIFVISEKGRLFAVLEGANDLINNFSLIMNAQVPDN